MFDSSSLASGFSLDDPVTFSKRLNRMISIGLSGDNNENLQEDNDNVHELENLDDSKMEEVD